MLVDEDVVKEAREIEALEAEVIETLKVLDLSFGSAELEEFVRADVGSSAEFAALMLL